MKIPNSIFLSLVLMFMSAVPYYLYGQELNKPTKGSNKTNDLKKLDFNQKRPFTYLPKDEQVSLNPISNNTGKDSTDIAMPMVFNDIDDVFYAEDDWANQSIFYNDQIIYLGNGIIESTYWRGFTLTSYDTLGNVNWEKIIADSNVLVTQANDIYVHEDSDIFVGGVIYQNPTDKWDRFLTKIDQNGDTIFYQVYSDTVSNFLIDIAWYSSDTIMLLSAWQDSIGDMYSRIVIDLVDLNGNIIYTHVDDYDLFRQVQIIRFQDQIIVGGTYRNSSGSNYNVKVFIGKYDLDLNYLGYNNISMTINEYFQNLNIVNGQLLLTSSITYLPYPGAYPNNRRTNLCYLNESLYPTGTYTFGPYYFSTVGGPSEIISNKYIATPISRGSNYIYLHDLNFNELCHFSVAPDYNPPYFESFYGIDFIPPHFISGYGGITEYNGTQEQWFFLSENIDHVVDSLCSTVSINEQYNKEAMYLMNYHHGILSIKSLDDKNRVASLYIYNSTGEMVLSDQVNYAKEISLSSLQKGMYIAKIQNATVKEVFKFIIL